VLRHHDENIKHLCFPLPICEIYMVNHPSSFLSVSSMLCCQYFGNQLHGIDHWLRMLIKVGVLAVIWSLWLCRNDKVFSNKNCSLLQVIYGCTGTLRLWLSMVASAACRKLRPIYGGLYMVRERGEGYLFPTWVTA
jgi:hypothetical protein